MEISNIEMYCRKPIAVFHSADPDGVYSAWACSHFYINSYIARKCNAVLSYMPWNYGDSITIADEDLLDKASIIFMMDITLPDKYMDKYASKIVWLDHHFSATERSKKCKWGSRLFHNGSKVGTAACKLVWDYFFEDELETPYFIEYAAKYDIWDKGEIEVDYFNCYNRKHLHFGTAYLKRNNFEALKENFAYINSEITENRLNVMFEGKKLYNEREAENMRQCKVMAHYGELFRHSIAIANFDKCNSDWFKWIIKKHPDIEYLFTFDYVFSKKAWRVSAYTSSTNMEGNALEFLQSIAKGYESDIISLGGHKDACGMICTNIEKMLLSNIK